MKNMRKKVISCFGSFLVESCYHATADLLKVTVQNTVMDILSDMEIDPMNACRYSPMPSLPTLK